MDGKQQELGQDEWNPWSFERPDPASDAPVRRRVTPPADHSSCRAELRANCPDVLTCDAFESVAEERAAGDTARAMEIMDDILRAEPGYLELSAMSRMLIQTPADQARYDQLEAAFREAIADELPPSPSPGGLKFGTLPVETMKELLEGKAELFEPVIEGIAYRGLKTLLVGQSKAGKSFTILAKSIEAARAGKRVLYLSEESKQTLVDKLRKFGADTSIPLYVTRKSHTAGMKWEAICEQAGEAARSGIDLIVVDTARPWRRDRSRRSGRPPRPTRGRARRRTDSARRSSRLLETAAIAVDLTAAEIGDFGPNTRSCRSRA